MEYWKELSNLKKATSKYWSFINTSLHSVEKKKKKNVNIWKEKNFSHRDFFAFVVMLNCSDNI